jgi:hypothetical protein
MAIDFAVTTPIEFVVPCTVTHFPTARSDAVADECSVTAVVLETGIVTTVDPFVSTTTTAFVSTVLTVPTMALKLPKLNFLFPKEPDPNARPGRSPPVGNVAAEQPLVAGRIVRARTTAVDEPDGVTSTAETHSPARNELALVVTVWAKVVDEPHLTVDSPVEVP